MVLPSSFKLRKITTIRNQRISDSESIFRVSKLERIWQSRNKDKEVLLSDLLCAR